MKQAGIGYATAALADESSARREMWMPLWDAPTGFREVQALMSEGRAQVGGGRLVMGWISRVPLLR